MTNPIPWYYMWSENYRFFYEILKDYVKESEFIMSPIEIPQERFDSELYQSEDKHFWHGSLIKVNAVIDSLTESQKNGHPYILFTDIDIIVKPGIYAEMKPYMESGIDMVYLKEGSTVNIGFMLLRVCSEVIDFWNQVRLKMIDNVGIDQNYINKMLPNYSGKHGTFDDQVFTLSNMWNRTTEYKVLQLLCSCLGKEYNMAEKIFSAAQHINVEPYMKYVKPDIIPYIYAFQEYIYRQHKQGEHAVNS